MDYKQFQRAIADRLGSQFGVSVIISFVFINWELLFKMADSVLSIDSKIEVIKLWDFRLGWFIVDIFIIILIFQLGNLIAKSAGTYLNKVLWGKILRRIGDKTLFVDRDDHELALKDMDELKATRENYSKDIDRLKEGISTRDSRIKDLEDDVEKRKKDSSSLQNKLNEADDRKGKLSEHIDLSVEAIKSLNEAVLVLLRRNAQRTVELDSYFDTATDFLKKGGAKFGMEGLQLEKYLKQVYYNN